MSYRGATGQPQLWADERNGTPPFVNCVAASGVNLAGAATLGHVPTSDAEVSALRKATGDVSGGENLNELAAGMRVRYGWTGTLDESWQTIVSGLVSGHRAFAVVGRYDHLPPAYRTPQPSFAGGHCVYVGGNGPNTAWWVDPLDRTDNGHPRGRSIPFNTLRQFCASMAYGSLGLREGSHAPPLVHVDRGLFFLYDDKPWRRSRKLTGGFSAHCTKPVTHLILGEDRPMVELIDGSRRGHYVAINEPHVHYST